MASVESICAPQRVDSKILNLNDDVLLQIFMLNTDIDFDTPHIPSRTIRYTSQVSVRWRSLTLDSKTLWASSLNLADNASWIQTVLDRTRDYPLTITYPPFSNETLFNQYTLSAWRHLEYEHRMTLVHGHNRGLKSDISKLDMALSLFSRCRRFRLLLCYNNEWIYARKKSISLDAPHLEELSIEVNHCYDNTDSPTSTIFDVGRISHRPNLKILHLFGYTLKPPTFEPETFLNLTTLIIDGQRSMVAEWVRILSYSPRMEVLQLKNCFNKNPISIQDVGENLTPIFLSKLRSIMFNGYYVELSMMLSLIRFPPLCAMDFQIWWVGDEHYSLVTKTLSLLQKTIQDFVSSQKVTDLSLFLKRYPGLGWKLWNNIHSADEKTFCLTWVPQYCCTVPFSYLKQILEVVTPDLTSFYLDTARIRDSELPLTSGILQGLDNVKSLSIPTSDTLEYVLMLFKGDCPANRRPSVLPALEMIILDSLNLPEHKKGIAYNIFKIRSLCGAPIPQCLVKGCAGPFLEALIEDLRGLGVQVEWDGKNEERDVEKPNMTRTLVVGALGNPP